MSATGTIVTPDELRKYLNITANDLPDDRADFYITLVESKLQALVTDVGVPLDTTDPDIKYYVLNKAAEEYLNAVMGTEGIFIRVGNMLFNRRDMSLAVQNYRQKASRHLKAYLRRKGALKPYWGEIKVITRTLARMFEIFKEPVILRKKTGETRDARGYIVPQYTDYTVDAVIGYDSRVVETRDGTLKMVVKEQIYVIFPDTIDVSGVQVVPEIGDHILWGEVEYIITTKVQSYKGFIQFYAERVD